MPQFKTLLQQKQDFPPKPESNWQDLYNVQRARYMRRYNPMVGKASKKKRDITKLKSQQSAMSQLDQTLNKFVTRQPRSYGIDVVERKNLNYSYHRIKTLKKARAADDYSLDDEEEEEHMGSKPTLWKVARLKSLHDG